MISTSCGIHHRQVSEVHMGTEHTSFYNHCNIIIIISSQKNSQPHTQMWYCPHILELFAFHW